MIVVIVEVFWIGVEKQTRILPRKEEEDEARSVVGTMLLCMLTPPWRLWKMQLYWKFLIIPKVDGENTQ